MMDNNYNPWEKNPFLFDDETPTEPIDRIMDSENDYAHDESGSAYRIGYFLGAAIASLLMIAAVVAVFASICLGLAWLLS